MKIFDNIKSNQEQLTYLTNFTNQQPRNAALSIGAI